MEKEIILKNIEENLLTIKYINQYNSSIKENSINEFFTEIPFKFINDKIEFNKIKSVTSLGHESLLSLFNLKIIDEKSSYNNELFHLLSYSYKDNSFYINFNLLKILNNVFNEYYYELLLSLKNYKNLKQILLYLYNGFSFNKKKNILTTSDKIETIFKELKNFLNIKNNLYINDNKYYYFNVVDLNIYKNITADLKSIKDNNIKSLGNFLYIYNIYKDKENIKTIKLPFVPFTDNNKDLTNSQITILNNLNYSFNYILGTAGSGKTRILSRYFPNFKHWQAFSIANNLLPLPILYTSYSNSTNQIFYKHLEKSIYHKKIDELLNFTFLDLVFYIDRNNNNDSNLNQYTYNSITKRLLIKKEEINLQKLINIKQKLQKHNNNIIIQQYQILLTLIEDLTNYQNIFSLKEKQFLKNIFIKLKYNNHSLLKRIILFLFNQKQTVNLTKQELIILRKIYPYISQKININNNSFILDILYNIKNILLNKKEFSIYEDLYKQQIKKLEFPIKEISEQDYYYYLLFHYYLEDDKTIEKYKTVLKKIINNHKLVNEEIDLFKKLFMLHISNISDLNYYIPTEFNYYMCLVDEALLIPNYLTYSILSRTNFLTIVGDLSQMTFYHLLPKTVLLNDVKKLYGKSKSKYEMFLNENNNKINSFYDLISYKKTFKDNKFHLLLDNFRYNKNIYEALFQLSDEYEIYRQNQNIEIESKINNIIPFYWEYINNINKPIKSNLLFLETDYYNKIETYKKIFKNIKTENNYKEFNSYKIKKQISLAIITPFSSDKKQCKDIIKKIENSNSNYFLDKSKPLYENLSVLSIYEIQGMEFDIVIFDTFLDSDKIEYETILSNKPQILTVSISRSKNIFILIGQKEKFESTESIIHKNIRNIIKEKFEFI